MSRLVESLKRLYESGKRNAEEIIELNDKHTITKTELEYILGD